MVCGQLYHTTTPVVLWTDPGGYDAYRLEPRFQPLPSRTAERKPTDPPEKIQKSRYGTRRRGLTDEEIEQVRGGGWDLPLLRKAIDQFVIHFDARGTSRGCFEVLHDRRDLSVHFMLDLDGTIYQTPDVKEQAWHATIANGRSIGIEVANIGAYPPDDDMILGRWYQRGAGDAVEIRFPNPRDREGIRNKAVALRPARNTPVEGTVQGQALRQYDFTEAQYEALIRLTATLCTIFPEITCDYPRDAEGKLRTAKLPDPDLASYHGILGHFHVQTNKIDPGPAFQWDRLVTEAKALMNQDRSEE
jgi:N-acetyl-anhydromuramyl-L-alanine amidase AmpD